MKTRYLIEILYFFTHFKTKYGLHEPIKGSGLKTFIYKHPFSLFNGVPYFYGIQLYLPEKILSIMDRSSVKIELKISGFYFFCFFRRKEIIEDRSNRDTSDLASLFEYTLNLSKFKRFRSKF